MFWTKLHNIRLHLASTISHSVMFPLWQAHLNLFKWLSISSAIVFPLERAKQTFLHVRSVLSGGFYAQFVGVCVREREENESGSGCVAPYWPIVTLKLQLHPLSLGGLWGCLCQLLKQQWGRSVTSVFPLAKHYIRRANGCAHNHTHIFLQNTGDWFRCIFEIVVPVLFTLWS